MTREEALIQLRLGPGINEDVSEEYNEAVDIAIKAIRTIPSEDEQIIRISKGALKARTGKYVIYDVEWLKEHFNTTEAKIYGQSKEEPQQKTGHWIEPQQDDGMSDPIYYQVRCSECNFDLDPQTWAQELHQYGADKYCPRCGAKMQEVQE